MVNTIAVMIMDEFSVYFPFNREAIVLALCCFRNSSLGSYFSQFSSKSAYSLVGKHGKIDPVGTDEIDPVKTA